MDFGGRTFFFHCGAKSPRRSPHLRVYVLVLLAREQSAQDDRPGLAESLADAQALLDDLRKAGIQRHPWLTMLQASVYALGGDDERAEQQFAESIKYGWRAWLLERYGVAEPLTHLQLPIRKLEEELAALRNSVSSEGLLTEPKE